LACVGAVAGAETVYKWVDGAGQVHYDYDEEGGDDAGDSGAAPQASGTPRTPEPPVSDAALAAAEADALKAKVEQCKAAQDRYQRYIESRRLFREKPDGTREYLTDQELTEARARAKQAVDDYCN
jgi:hypothetical protein